MNMKQKIYQVDAFTDKVFSGNPAAICPLEKWLSDDIMQKIAMENNLAETAFCVKDKNGYIIRWFTPAVEVDLCGHATLATAYVLFNILDHQGDIIYFESPRSGKLTVTRNKDMLTLNFPTDKIEKVELTDAISEGLSIKPVEAYKGKSDYLLIYENENQVRSLVPDFKLISKLGDRGVIVTAKGNKSDFVSRFFAPQAGIDEDPVTGSAHTTLTPYWANVLKKYTLSAIQVSKRGGHLTCRYLNDRVEITGQCRLYMTGELELE